MIVEKQEVIPVKSSVVIEEEKQSDKVLQVKEEIQQPLLNKHQY